MNPANLKRVIDPLLSASPTFKVTQSSHEVDAIRRRVSSHLDQLLTRDDLDEAESSALFDAVSDVGAHAQLTAALSGDGAALTTLTELLITSYLSRRPWGQLSERELANLWYGWVEALSEGSTVHSEALWVDCPTVSMSQWVDRGWHAVLERAWSTVTPAEAEEMNTPRLIGVRVSGPGKSAHLAYARRWLMDQGAAVDWLTSELTSWVESTSATDVTPLKDQTSIHGLLIDDLHLPTRDLQWALAIKLTQWRSGLRRTDASRASAQVSEDVSGAPSLIVLWGDDETSSGVSALLSAEVDELITMDLEAAWRPHEQMSSERDATLIDIAHHHPDLTRSDHLRFRDLIRDPSRQAAQFDVSDIDAYAALIGPLASMNVLVRTTELTEESLREILGNAGWIEVDQHPQAGSRFAPPSPEFWRAALLAGGARAHRCAASLQTELERVYLGESLLEVSSALQRLSLLRGRGAYRGQIHSALDVEAASRALRDITPALTLSHPSPLALTTLCGLGLDWAQIGPLTGRWDEALRALKLGVASAQRLRDPQRASQLLLMLGKLALDDGRASVADESLEAALKIAQATRRADEACRAAQLLAETSLLRGAIDQALSRLSAAQDIALELSLPREAWRSRFRAGQLWALLGDHQQALSLWTTLQPAQERASEHERQRAVLTLTLECASSLLHLQRTSEAWNWLERSPPQAPLGQALLAVCRWRMSAEDVREALKQCADRARGARDIGSWVAIQRWRSLVSLEMHAQRDLQGDETVDIRALAPIQRDLELAVRVLVGARDRLQLITVYQLLARVYRAQDQQEASEAALAMARGWRQSLTAPPQAEVLDLELFEVSLEISAEALTEVEALCTQWGETPLSVIAASIKP